MLDYDQSVASNKPAPALQASATQDDTQQLNFFDYSTASARFQKLEGDWTTEKTETKRRRLIRQIDIDVNTLRAEKKIAQDETMIPIRLADTNIRRELPPYIAYLKQSRRLAIFKPECQKKQPVEIIEGEFTRVCQYNGWEIPYIKVLDGAFTHGWDFVEIEFDESKPGQVDVTQVGHDNLFFPPESIDIQASEFIMREYQVTLNQLRGFVQKYGFDKSQVEKLAGPLNAEPARNDALKLHRAYKIMFKNAADGLVYVGWVGARDSACDDFLKKPEPLYLGVDELTQVPVQKPSPPLPVMNPDGSITQIQQPPITVMEPQWNHVFETAYPYELLFYEEGEEPEIFKKKGRVFLDKYKQEAMTSIWSSFVNRMNRASNVYASPKQQAPAGDGIPKLLQVDLMNGGMYNNAVEFFSIDFPSPVVIQAAEALAQENAQETLQVDYTARNRQDSRKTAEEVKSANQEASLLNGVRVTIFSTFMRRVLTRVWRIVQSRALQDKIMFCQIPSQDGINYENDKRLVGDKYMVFAAGDVDVVARQEKIQKMMQFWGVIQGTPLAPIFLGDLLLTAFPEDGQKYVDVLKQGMMQGQNQAALATALESVKNHPGVSGDKEVVSQIDNLLAKTSGGQAPQSQ